MIYVEENDFDRKIALLEFVASFQDLRICAWLFPESNVSELAGIAVADNTQGFIPVTIYENGVSPKCTVPTLATTKRIRAFGSSHTELKKNCDSLALYKNNQVTWLAAMISHENICLVQDESLVNRLIQVGYSATTRAPDWW